jgi:cytochrome c-type biogenesis protein CcmH/NrfF
VSRRAGLLLALLVALTAAAPAQAIPPEQRGEAFNRLEKKVMCIECNVPLNIAEAAQADATRTQMRRLLDRDLSEQQVLDQLVEDYGPNILASPKAEGFNVLAYLVPVLALAALLACGAVLLPRWKRNRAEAGSGEDDIPPPDLSRADTERLDAELARYGA